MSKAEEKGQNSVADWMDAIWFNLPMDSHHGHEPTNPVVRFVVLLIPTVLMLVQYWYRTPLLLAFAAILLALFCFVRIKTDHFLGIVLFEVVICKVGFYLLKKSSLNRVDQGTWPPELDWLCLVAIVVILTTIAATKVTPRDFLWWLDKMPGGKLKSTLLDYSFSFIYTVRNIVTPLRTMRLAMRCRNIPSLFTCSVSRFARGFETRLRFLTREAREIERMIGLLVVNRVQIDRRKSKLGSRLSHADIGLLTAIFAMSPVTNIVDVFLDKATGHAPAAAASPANLTSPTPPRLHDPGLQIELILNSDVISTPTGIAVDKHGRLWVLENRTHFVLDRASHTDRVLIFEPQPGKEPGYRMAAVYAEGLRNSMGITLVNGEVYVAGIHEVQWLPDVDKNLRAEAPVKLVSFVSDSLLQLKGLSGFAFRDDKLYFGLGENFGHACRLVTTTQDIPLAGDTGAVFELDLKSSTARQVARGFWRPFAMTFRRDGTLLCVDNDPNWDPCRLLHIIDGGDYGYRFSSSGYRRQPLSAWNGEIPGTLPMVAQTSESPTGILECAGAGLGKRMENKIIVSCWAANRLEMYDLTPRGVSWQAARAVLCEGDKDFRPVAIAQGPDGSLFISDWVEEPYSTTRRGRIWRLSQREAPGGPPPATAPSLPARLSIEFAANGGSVAELKEALRKACSTDDPFLLSAAVSACAASAPKAEMLAWLADDDPKLRRGGLLAMLKSSSFDAGEMDWARLVNDPDETVQHTALRVALELKSQNALPLISNLIVTRQPSPELIQACAASMERIATVPDRASVWHDVVNFAAGPNVKPETALALLSGAGEFRKRVQETTLQEWSASSNQRLAIEATRVLALRASTPDRLVMLAESPNPALACEAITGLARFVDQSQVVKDALLALARDPDTAVATESRRSVRSSLSFGELDGWRAFAENPLPAESVLRGDGDEERGRFIFANAKAGNCVACHIWEGLGGRTGHDLTGLPQVMARLDVLDAVLNPDREIAPQYKTWEFITGTETVTATLVEEQADAIIGGTSEGKESKIQKTAIQTKRVIPGSLCSKGAMHRLSLADLRDLVAFLGGMD